MTRAEVDKAMRASIKARITQLTIDLVDTPAGSRREISATIRDLEQLLARPTGPIIRGAR